MARTKKEVGEFAPVVMHVRVTYTESVLGSQPGDKDIYSTYIGSRSPDTAKTMEEELMAIGQTAVEEKTKTIFPKFEDGSPFAWDYQWMGFFKDTAGGLRRITGTISSGISAYKKLLDTTIFVKPRKIPFDGVTADMLTDCQRPLRASTPQGERIALANSEEVPAGTTQRFDIICFNKSDVEWVREMLNFGRYRGFGQWRNSGRGRFLWDELDDEGCVIGGNMEALG